MQPCQNCTAKGRHCVLQVHAGRSGDTPNVTSRDRIRQLEDSVGKLWSVVRELRNEHGQTHTEPAQNYGLQSEEQYNDESESDASEISPMNPPTHLQQLFDNEILDTRGSGINSPESSSDKATSTLMLRARTRLQALVPPKVRKFAAHISFAGLELPGCEPHYAATLMSKTSLNV